VPEVPVDWNTPHRFVGWGYFPLPKGFSGSFTVEARSGFPYTLVNDLNRVVGRIQRPAHARILVTNASVEKQIPIPLGKRKADGIRVGVTNLFNRFNPAIR
jgi:hypothetical protein